MGFSECTGAQWGEELLWESSSINNCVIHNLSLIGGVMMSRRREGYIEGHSDE